MQSRVAIMGLGALLLTSGFALAQPTPTPVDSNIAVQPYAYSLGATYANGTPTPATCPGNTGCGGCYPIGLNSGLLDLLPEVDPEWQGIGPMISGGPDTSLPPQSQPVTIHGTVALTKINEGGDFPGSHVGDDQNTFIQLDPSDNGFLATGNQSTVECGPPPGENCNLVEMELEFKRYPLFVWAGEGDRINAKGRWIFDCGHPDPEPVGGCTGLSSTQCVTDGDCCAAPTAGCLAACGGGFCSLATGVACSASSPCGLGQGTCTGETCSNNSAVSCTANTDCNFGTCDKTNLIFNYRSELHPPQGIAVLRNKSKGKTPATQADVYISADGGGAGDLCTVTHLANASDVLFAKSCFLNHCSVTTSRSCATDKDCGGKETCVIFDNAKGGPVANVNATDFEFDMPLPAPPSSTSTLKVATKSFKPKGGIMPKPVFTFPTLPLGPNPVLHVTVPMSVPVPIKNVLPNVFAERITAYWKEDTTKLTHVQVKFKSLDITNPLKAAIPAIPLRQCTNTAPVPGGLSGTPCSVDKDCPAGTCNTSGAPCHTDQNCKTGDFCTNGTTCVGGTVPGWEMFGEVNGDWVQFAGKALSGVGTASPFAAPPYNSDDLTAAIKGTFDEYVPSNGAIHIATTGHSTGCTDVNLYGHNLKDSLTRFGLGAGAACFEESDANPGPIDIIHNGPNFVAEPPNGLCTGLGTPFGCCTGSGAGTCSVVDACTGLATPFACCTGLEQGVCPEVTCVPPSKSNAPTVCTVSPGEGDGGTCSVTTTRLCLKDADCPAGTCSNNPSTNCHTNSDCIGGGTCTAGETCNGHCSDDSGNPGASCHTSADCTSGGTCLFGPAFELTYTIQVK